MARSRDLDLLTEFRFHLFDVKPAIPSLFPFVLNPEIGFTSITPPALTLEKARITPGNSYYPHQTILRASQSTITLRRGASLQDGDFWRWYIAALTGESGSLNAMPGKRKDLLLVHLSLKNIATALSGYSYSRALKAAGQGFFNPGSVATFGLLGRVPSRAWILYDCQPAGYTPIGNLDASSSNIGIRELSLDYSDIDEINLGL